MVSRRKEKSYLLIRRGSAWDTDHPYSRVPIQAREKKNRHGNIGSGRRFSLLTKRSFMTNRAHNTAETTSNEIEVPEFQENEVPASKSTVTRSRVAPNRKTVPNTSNLAREAEENFCRRVGATYDALPWWGKFFGMLMKSRMTVNTPAGTLNND